MYIGNDLQIAHPSYKIIDDISSGFNGSTTSFALQVSGATPVPFPISTQQVMISVNGVVQEPDPTGSAGFKLLGSNIVFSSAPANGHAFFGVINAGADYVTAGSEFPDGSATAPSFTFQDDQDTGWFRSGSGAVGYSANGAQTLTFDGNGLTVTGDASFVGDSSKNLLWDKSDGALEFADNTKAVFGTDSDFQIYHDGTNNYIKHVTAGAVYFETTTNLNFRVNSNENAIVATANGAVELYHNNVKKFETASDRVNITGHMISTGTVKGTKLSVDDSNKATFGDSDDLEIYHDGSHSYIKNGQGSLKICDTNVELMNGAADEYMLKAIQDGAVELYHNNSKSFYTTDNGAVMQGYEGVAGIFELHADEGDDNADKWRFVAESGSTELSIGNYSTGSWVNALIVDGPGRLGLKTNSMSSYNGSADDLVIDNGASDVGITLDSEAQCSIAFTDSAKTGWDGWMKYIHSSNSLQFGSGAAAALTLNSSQNATFAGSVTDSKGNLRSIPHNSGSNTVTLAATDAGKVVSANGSGGVGWIIPASTFSAGDAVTLMNRSGGNLTITATALTALYNGADGANVKASTLTLATRTMATIWFEDANNAYIQASALTVS